MTDPRTFPTHVRTSMLYPDAAKRGWDAMTREELIQRARKAESTAAALVGELTEARQQLETAQQRAEAIREQAFCDAWVAFNAPVTVVPNFRDWLRSVAHLGGAAELQTNAKPGLDLELAADDPTLVAPEHEHIEVAGIVGSDGGLMCAVCDSWFEAQVHE